MYAFLFIIICCYIVANDRTNLCNRIAQNVFFPGIEHVLNKEETTNWKKLGMENLFPLYQYMNDSTYTVANVEDEYTYEMILAMQENDETLADDDLIEYNQPTKENAVSSIDMSIEKLKDFDYLLSHFYTVDSTTTIGPDQLNAEELLGKSMKINQKSEGPKVLIYHTHSQEAFANSISGDTSTSIVGIGAYLTELLNARGISTIHHTGVYDFVNGKLDRSEAYQQAEVAVKQILKQNSSIEVVIDLHRDGVPESTHLVTTVDGKQSAKIMFFNGLSRTKTNGNIDYLYNPYIQDNLSFSLQMQLMCEKLYPGFARRIYLRGYRYSMHLMPKTLLIEAGAQTNTVEEMKNAMDLLANVLAKVLL